MGKIIKTKVKEKHVLTAEEAIENLSTIAEMDIDKKTPIGILQNTRLTTTEEDFSYKEIEWLYPEDMTGFIERIKPTFEAILHHLREIHASPTTDWNDDSTKNGVISIMTLVVDAANKLNQYFLLFNKDIDFTKTKEFIDIKQFYIEGIEKKFPMRLDGTDRWTVEWEQNKEKEAFDLDKSGAKDFSVIEADIDYELFYIKNVNKEPIFSPDLIKNIKLYTYFEGAVEDKEHLFYKINGLINKDLHFSAKQILKSLDKEIRSFYKGRFDWKTNQLAGNLNKSFMALMLASNPRIFSKSDTGKSSLRYFNDFKNFLRACFTTGEYQRTLTYEKSKKERNYILLSLANKLCLSFFSRLGGIKEEVIAYIHRMIRKGASKDEKIKPEESFWNLLLQKDDNFRSYLKKFPNGPLVKIVEDLENIKPENLVFDPVFQGNNPHKLYEIVAEDRKMDVIHLPSPTHQEDISSAVIIDEFLGFLRSIAEKKDGKLLMINFQNSASYREEARCKALYEIHKRAEFESVLTIVTLPKNTEFYHQANEFVYMSDANEFISTLKSLVLSKVDRGFFLTKDIQNKRIFQFIDNIFAFIHETFFMEKADLSKQERKDFCEIFYNFLILKMIELNNPTFISFTSKDSVDVASAANAAFFSFVKMLSSPNWKDEDKDFLLYLIYEPALLIRMRAIEPENLIRHLSVMACFEAHVKGLKKGLKKFYNPDFIDSLKVNYLH